MKKEERQKVILEYLSKEHRLTLMELSAYLNVSEDTIRRDVKELSDQGLLKAVRGGAVAPSPIPLHFRNREKHDLENKKIIAEKAISYLKDGQVVFIDGGTTSLALVASFPYDLKITVITNSFPVAALIEDLPNIELIFAGGRMCKTSFTTASIETIDFFRNFRADICILGLCSIHHERGVTGILYDDSQIKRNMIQHSDFVIALGSIEKVGTAESYSVCPIKDINVLVTNIDPEDESLKFYKDAGLTIV
ncbi:DeoR/GlpR family DNA-binding transcription regulator [Flavobacterium collinsii]|uniref:HTH-type transcriptional repressor GlcR n=1 Tax=Flavobacterium collinsii TaxID=1114861 RepID=A0A9W4XBT8_9FLAO|nr:DeoR/GlpR family DNA-binding transcription regulator [Flavobacterium collinsii]GIQ57088.1 DeoR family transcriptional regulator [Flavobacterium collinsii]CAA9198914.1 HTH-type transcriptional repressor GlcR [Flavobacterium collinsii]CAI2769237.1 HTH-type transcriptional repressor GlcR [Flavobacterium collinsii]